MANIEVVGKSVEEAVQAAAAELKIPGRHDVCIALRMPVIAEAATAIVLADLLLLEQRVPRVAKGEKDSKDCHHGR